MPLLISGCAGNPVRKISGIARALPLAGTVRIDVIAKANPQWMVIRKIDQALGNDQGQAWPNISEQTPMQGQSAVRPDAAPSARHERRLVAIQTQHLSALQREILENLTVRLQRADDEHLEADQSRLDAETEQTYRSRVEAINEQAATNADQVRTQDRTKIVNLTAKIHALTVDVQPPPTAPDGYWAARLKARQGELSDLESRRHALIDEIGALQDQSRRDLRAQLQRQANTVIEEAAASAQMHRAAVLAATRQRLQAQTADILTSSKALDFEADRAAQASEKAASPAMPKFVSMQPGMIPPSMAQRVDLIALQRERTRLQGQIREQTLQTVTEVARSRNVVIVGYRHQPGVRDITDDVLKWVKADRWG